MKLPDLVIEGPIIVKIYSHSPITCRIYHNDNLITVLQKKDSVYISHSINPGTRRNAIRIVITAEAPGAIQYKLIVKKNTVYHSPVLDIPKPGLFSTEIKFLANPRLLGSRSAHRKSTPAEPDPDPDAVMMEPLQLFQHLDDYEVIEETSVPVPVYYCTSRNPIEKKNKTVGYDNRFSEDKSYGVGMVSIPLNRRRGELPRPKWWKCQWKENPEKHVMIINIDPLTGDDYFEKISAEARLAPSNDVLLFIHGFNESFASSLRRAAQLAFDINFTGITSVFSWPSLFKGIGYLADIENVRYAIDDLTGYIERMRATPGVGKIHLLAHSMGNEPLTAALVNLVGNGTNKAFKESQVILAAPDMDERYFKGRISSKIVPYLEQITLYASSRDIALIGSQLLRLNKKRLGKMGNRFSEIAGVDLVSASKQCTDLLGHGYFSQTKPMIRDIRKIIKKGLKPAERKLEPKKMRGKQYWTFKNKRNNNK